MSRDDIDDELRFHVESRVRDLVAEGLSAADARAQAEREFGDRATFRDQCRGIRQTTARQRERRDYWTGWSHDLRYAARAIAGSPLFSVAAITILTVGIGLTSTVFAVVHGVFLNPLPYPQSRQLHRIYAVNVEKNIHEAQMSAGDFFTLRSAMSPEINVGAYMNWPASLTGVPDPERLTGALVSADLFKTLGVNAVEGRTFLVEDEDPDRNVVIISTRLAARLGLAGRAAGASIELGRRPATVVGVMPASFQFPQHTTDIWIPLALRPADRDNHASRYLHTIARVDRRHEALAHDRLRTAMAGLAAQFPASNAGWTTRTVPLHDVVIGPTRATLAFLAAAIACLVLVMVVNLVTLITSRLHRRTTELSVQQALGADRWRLLRQLGTECLLMTIAGATLGLVLASGLLGAFQQLAATSVPRANEVALSPWIVAFAIAVALLGLMAMTLLPLWRSIAVTASPVSHTVRGAASSPQPSRVLVIAQSALACLLMVAAGLLAQTYLRLSHVDLGFTPDDVLTMRIALPANTPLPRQAAYFSSVVDRIRSVPGVITAGAVSDLPLGGNSLNVPIAVADTAAPAAFGDELRSAFRVVTPGYFETIRTPVRGRSFDAADTMGRQPVAMVNDAFVRRHWPDRDPIGLRLRTSADPAWRTVVGVVRDIQHGDLTGNEGPAIFVPHAQKAEGFVSWMWLTVRATGEPIALAQSVRAAIATVDRYQPVSDVRALTALVDEALALPRLATTIAAVAAGGSLLLAAMGIGAVLSLLVAARTPDFAVRLALGAPPARLKWMPVVECVMLVGAGGTLGLIGAVVLARLMRSLLFGVSPLDAATFAMSLATLMAIALLTAIGPARAIARIDPTMTLRS
jgi:putative ABC transport system permease protein